MNITQEKIVALRNHGKSYNEIARTLDISKSTVSYWLHGIPLTPFAKKKLEKKMERARKLGLLAFNKKNRKW